MYNYVYDVCVYIYIYIYVYIYIYIYTCFWAVGAGQAVSPLGEDRGSSARLPAW